MELDGKARPGGTLNTYACNRMMYSIASAIHSRCIVPL